MIRAFVKSVEYMSPRELVLWLPSTSSGPYKNTLRQGFLCSANISAELLVNILSGHSLHDGAVIIRKPNSSNLCLTYMTESTGISKEFGTRHPGRLSGLSRSIRC